VSTADVGAAKVPATLQATIGARIDRLDLKAKRTLSAAVVIGSRFGLDLFTVLGVEPVIAELLAVQLIDQVRFTRQPEYVFHHPLIRTVAYEAQLKSDRAELHRRRLRALPGSLPRRVEIAWLRGAYEVGRGDAMTAPSQHLTVDVGAVRGAQLVEQDFVELKRGPIEQLLSESLDAGDGHDAAAVNLLIKKILRVGHGLRNFHNYRLRSLLHCEITWQNHTPISPRGRLPRLAA